MTSLPHIHLRKTVSTERIRFADKEDDINNLAFFIRMRIPTKAASDSD